MCREITYYTCTALMFLFGLKMIWEAWRMGGDEAEETRREVEEELGVTDTNRWGILSCSCLGYLQMQIGKGVYKHLL